MMASSRASVRRWCAPYPPISSSAISASDPHEDDREVAVTQDDMACGDVVAGGKDCPAAAFPSVLAEAVLLGRQAAFQQRTEPVVGGLTLSHTISRRMAAVSRKMLRPQAR